MSTTIVKRIEALEIADPSTENNLRIVIAEPGETAAEALRREGIAPDAGNVLVAVFG